MSTPDHTSTATEAGMPDYQVSWAEVRGFNYQPSYAAHGLEIWNRLDDEIGLVDTDLARGREHFPGINSLRIWLSWDSFMSQPRRCADQVGKMLDLLGKYDLQAMPVLFNGWYGMPYFGGLSSAYYRKWRRDPEWWGRPVRDYVKAVVGRYADDPRILAWDLCNEPQGSEIGVDFFRAVYAQCKDLGAVAPITVGNEPGLKNLAEMEPVSDVLSTHPYGTNVEDMRTLVAYARNVGKPIVATECCWGSTDDKKRVENIRNDLGVLKKLGVGFMPHLLCHTAVADGHRPGDLSYTGPSTYMAFIEADGSIRPGHDVYNEF